MNNILFPTDFSKTARHAFVYALKIAHTLGARITTLHVYQMPELLIDGPVFPNALQEIYDSIDMDAFENYRDSIPALREIAIAEGLEQVEVLHVLEKGETVPGILEVTRRDEIDLIVMGTEGAGWVKEVFRGSIAGNVLEKANCPVLVVPKNALLASQIKKIAVAVSYEKGEVEMIDKVIKFAAPFQASIHCLHVDQVGFDRLDKRMQRLEHIYDHRPEMYFDTIQGADLERSLSNYMQRHQMDILCMFTHHRSYWQKLFELSQTRQFSYHTHNPLLVMHTTP